MSELADGITIETKEESPIAKKLRDAIGSDKKIVALIDGDIVAYRCSATTDGRQYIVYLAGGEVARFPYHADANKFIIEQMALGISNESFRIDKVKIPDPVGFATSNVSNLIKSLSDSLGTTDLHIFLTADRLFRSEIMSEYKQNRSEADKPTHLKAAKQFLIENYGAVIEDGYEADDLISIASNEPVDNVVYVIVSLDKDLNTCPGWHYNWVHNQLTFISEEDAIRNFYIQVLTGDKTDNIEGLHGVGPVTAKKILKDVSGTDPFDYFKVSLEAYISKLKKEEGEADREYATRVFKRFVTTASMLYILKKRGERWTPPVLQTS